MKKILVYYLFICLLLFVFSDAVAQRVNINLNINESNEATVFQNEPVLLDIAVFSKKAQADNRWNLAGEERMQELNELLSKGKIRQEDYDREKASIEKNKRTRTSAELGSASASWTSAITWRVMNSTTGISVELSIRLLKKPSTDGKAVLDASGYYLACYGISQDEMKSIPAGTYAIECVINNIPSSPVLLKVEKGMMSESLANSEKMLLRLGTYYWHMGDGASTIRYADQVLSKNPASLDGLSLRGDGQVLQRYYLPALETYNKAVKEYYKQNGAGSEPPEYLLSMIGVVKEKLGDVKN